MYRHPIGRLSRGAVLDVGLKCTHSCKFCYYSYLDKSDDQFRGMRRAAFRSLEDCKEILRRLKDAGFINFDYTGGEPTLHPHIVEITRYAHQDLGLAGRIITLGQFLMKKMPHCRQRLIEDLLEAGLTNFLLSVHAVEEDLFHKITGETWAPLRVAMELLDAKGFQYTSNTTVFEWNYTHLPAIARELLRHRVYLHNFIIMNAYYEWNRDGQAFGVQARYGDIAPYLREAIDILESNGVAVNIRYAPLCAMRGIEKHVVGMVGVRYDPYEWMNQAGHFGGAPSACAAKIHVQEGGIEGYLAQKPLQLTHANGTEVIAMRGQHVKHFVAACRNCAARPVCDGIDANYLKQYGAEEFIPYAGTPWTAPLHRARADYSAPFLVKTQPHEDIRREVQREVTASVTAAAQPQALIMPDKRGRASATPRVSVVITCYNYARYLPDSVGSVLAQTSRDWELIIVDDGSTDDSRVVAERLRQAHPDREIRVVTQPNSGQPALARNSGIRVAQGTYILCLDADDKIAPTMLEESIALLDADPGISIAYTDRRDFDGVEQIVLAGEYDFPRLRYANHISYCAVYRKAAWDAVGGYRDNVRGTEDWDFWVASGARGHYGKRIPQPLFWYRRHDTGVFQDVIKNFAALRAQIILNNRQVYEPQAVSAAERYLGRLSETQQASRPLVSVIIPTRNRPERLKKAVASVLAQTYPNVEVVVVNDGGVEVEALLQGLDRDRIHYVRLAQSRERSAARNAGIRLTKGTYIAYLDDDDWYEPHHIETLVSAIETSGRKVAYGDARRVHEVKQGDGYVAVKTDVPYSEEFNPAALLVCNYIPILCVLHHRSCLDEAGLFDEQLSTHEDWDLWIRLALRYPFAHVKQVTCAFTWREDGSSTSSGRSENFLETAAVIHRRYAVESARNPDIIAAQARFRESQLARTRDNQNRRTPLCSIIMPVWNKVELTQQCLTRLAEVTHGVEFEVVLVDNGSTDGTPAFLKMLGGDVQILTNAENLGFAKACNQGAKAAKGEFLVFLNNDTIPLEGWLSALVEDAQAHPEVAVVGSKLLYKDGTIQHAGVAFSWLYGTPYHLYVRGRAQAPVVNRRREVQAVTAACMLVRREAFEAAGGFDEGFRNGFEDADLCLKIADRGGRIVYQPKSALYHLESQTPGRKAYEKDNAERLLARWSHKWWLSDEYALYAEDGMAYRIWKENGVWRDSLKPFADAHEWAEWQWVGTAQRLTHRRDAEALADLKIVLREMQAWPRDAQALRWGAHVCRHLGEPKLEEAFWRRLVDMEDGPEAPTALARLSLDAGRLDEADRQIARLTHAHPLWGEGWLLRGVLAMQGQAFGEAVSAFETAVQCGADGRKAKMGCGMAAIGEGRADRAWQAFLDILVKNPDDVDALHWLLRAGTALERWDELKEHCLRFVKRNPGETAVRLALAGVCLRSGDRSQARQEYDRLRLLDPAAEGLDELAKALTAEPVCAGQPV